MNSFQELPAAHLLFTEIGAFGLTALLIFAVFFLITRRAVCRVFSAVTSNEGPHHSRAELARSKVRAVAMGASPPPMAPVAHPLDIDVFISGHTHLPRWRRSRRRMAGARWWSTRGAGCGNYSPSCRTSKVHRCSRRDSC